MQHPGSWCSITCWQFDQVKAVSVKYDDYLACQSRVPESPTCRQWLAFWLSDCGSCVIAKPDKCAPFFVQENHITG